MPESRYGNKFSYWQPEDDPRSRGSLRQRILDESKTSSQQHQRKARTTYFKESTFPGTAAFDARTGKELPRTKRKAAQHQQPLDNEDVEVIENADTWSDYVYHSRVQAELRDIKAVTFAASHDHKSRNAHTACHDQTVVIEPGTHDTQSTSYAAGSVDRSDTLPALHEQYEEAEVASNQISSSVLADESYCIYTELIERTALLNNSLSQLQKTQVTSEAQIREILSSNHLHALSAHHDFFVATQHPSAPKALQQLATKYAMPNRMWQRTIKHTFDVLQSHSNHSSTVFIDLATVYYNLMNTLSYEVPQMSREWDLVKYNIRKYFKVLEVNGVKIPAGLTDQWPQSCSPAAQQMRTMMPPIVGSFFGDDDICERYYWSFLHQHSNGNDPGYARLCCPEYGYTKTALLLMSGWLTLGRKIATSFHAFVQTFLFLGLAFSTSPLSSSFHGTFAVGDGQL